MRWIELFASSVFALAILYAMIIGCLLTAVALLYEVWLAAFCGFGIASIGFRYADLMDKECLQGKEVD